MGETAWLPSDQPHEAAAELHAAEALRLVVGREGDAAFRSPCAELGRSVDVAYRE